MLQLSRSSVFGIAGVIEELVTTGGEFWMTRLASAKWAVMNPSFGVTRTAQSSDLLVIDDATMANCCYADAVLEPLVAVGDDVAISIY